MEMSQTTDQRTREPSSAGRRASASTTSAGDSEIVLARFPILKSSEKAYFRRFRRRLERDRARILERHGRAPAEEMDVDDSSTLDPALRSELDSRARFRAWALNDQIGFVEIVADRGNALRADVSLKRRAFPRSSPEHRWRRPLEAEEVLLFARVDGELVMPGNGLSYFPVVEDLVNAAQRLVRERGCGARAAVVGTTPPGIRAIDFATQHAAVLESG